MGRALPQAGLEEVDDQRPQEVEADQAREDDPRPGDVAPRVADAVPDVAVAGQRAGGHPAPRHQNSFSMIRERSMPDRPTSASSRSNVYPRARNTSSCSGVS